jgi:endonuclease YncB( thermonuclease family)
MARLRNSGPVWLTSSPRHVPLQRGRLRTGATLGRAAGLGLVATVLVAIAASSLPQPPARAGTPAATPVAGKDVRRLDARPVPSAPQEAPLPAPTSWTLFDARPAGALADSRLSAPPQAPSTAAEWRDAEFSQVVALDGRTIEAQGVRIRLSGLAIPAPEDTCRTLDGGMEACATRAATQLELVTRFRKVACRYRLVGVADAVGTCRLGTSDLAERLVKAGYVRRIDDNVRVAAAN